MDGRYGEIRSVHGEVLDEGPDFVVFTAIQLHAMLDRDGIDSKLARPEQGSPHGSQQLQCDGDCHS